MAVATMGARTAVVVQGTMVGAAGEEAASGAMGILNGMEKGQQAGATAMAARKQQGQGCGNEEGAGSRDSTAQWQRGL